MTQVTSFNYCKNCVNETELEYIKLSVRRSLTQDHVGQTRRMPEGAAAGYFWIIDDAEMHICLSILTVS